MVEGRERTLACKPHDFKKLLSPTSAASDLCFDVSVDCIAINASIKLDMFCLCVSQIQSNMISGRRLKMLKWTAIYYCNRVCIDCLQSTFFLKICLVLSQCNCNPRRYVTIRGVANGKIQDSLRRQDPSQKSQPETLW